ncbi:hypothetical protein Lfu02_49280 [Longispora fulva]|uniref:Uncharacterized protein n=1 Tax=Longispora fulva TaxID=619741 RepID=A0A8J7GMI8_9ACTN|nr:hypothetical protein [Longispora fulva]MBG6138305.1 hypothetical protein [Longispora fulva]GIG60556.1 hypothetical protein Lfu02_49280 [Longispora fulva]
MIWELQGPPRYVVLFSSPDAWRYSIYTTQGGTLSGRLDIPADAELAAARQAAADKVIAFGRNSFDLGMEVTWPAPYDSDSMVGTCRHMPGGSVPDTS